MTRTHTLRPLLLALALSLGTVSMPGCAQNTGYTLPTDGTLLSISAQALSKRVPDVANVSTGVITRAADANAAMRANAEQMDKVMAAVRAAGIAERDTQTSGVNLEPDYRYEDNKAPEITGYQARNTVDIKVRDMAKLGKVLDALVASGSNQINGPNFEIDEPEAAYDEARQAALKKARARADLYATSLGMQVRRIVSVSEGGGFQPPIPMAKMAMASGGSAERQLSDTAISPGETALSANLDVVFELSK